MFSLILDAIPSLDALTNKVKIRYGSFVYLIRPLKNCYNIQIREKYMHILLQ